MIRTNKIIADIDYSALDRKYDIFKITADKKIKGGAHILDSPFEEIKAKSICFQNGRELFILFDKNAANYKRLEEHRQKTENGDELTLRQINSKVMEQHLLIQLLFNSINNPELDILRFNNLTGKLYCWHKDFISKGKKQVITVEIKITKEMLLTLLLQTFTSGSEKDRIKFNKKSFSDYPQYTFDKNFGSFKRALKSDKLPLSKIYIPRQLDGQRNDVDFMNISDYTSFSKSKMGILDEAIKSFNKRFAGIVSINFDSQINFTELTFKAKKINKQNIEKIISVQNIHVVDGLKSENSDQLINNIIALLKENYFCKITRGSRIEKDKINIKLIHNKEYYEKRKIADQYEKNPDINVQHITYENCGIENAAGKIINTLVKELIIKNDIKKGLISIVEWEKYNYQNSWIFAKKYDDRYLFMTIYSDGSFSYKTLELDLFNSDEYQKYAEIFKSDNIVGIIVNHNGEINTIENTDWFTIPEFEKISSELKAVACEFDFLIEEILQSLERIEENTALTADTSKSLYQIKSTLEALKRNQEVISKEELHEVINHKTIKQHLNKIYENTDRQIWSFLRNEEKRSELLSSITDIKHFGDSDTEKYYFTGYIGAGMRDKINHACLIRKVSAVKSSKVFSEDLLPLMNVDFVSNGKLTVIPFPFKYLNEFAKTKS